MATLDVSVVMPAANHPAVRPFRGRLQYVTLFNSPPWCPPSPALRRLCELQTMRAGFVASKVECARGRLTGKQIVLAARRKLLVLCFGVLKSGMPFNAEVAMPA
jgi:hypothetical protein